MPLKPKKPNWVACGLYVKPRVGGLGGKKQKPYRRLGGARGVSGLRVKKRRGTQSATYNDTSGEDVQGGDGLLVLRIGNDLS